jgi:Mrp family chromosome partitioning ATPase
LATAARQSRFRSAILSSATGGEGTTSAAVNIGLHLMGDCGLNPLLIEVNRVRPSLTRLFQLDDQKSLAAMVAGGGSAMQYVQRTPAGLSVIPVGPADNAALLISRLESTLCHAVQELQNSFDFILLDAPAILESSDVMIAGRVVPQLVLVVGAGQSSQESLSRACQELKEARITLIGTILNSRKRIIPGWIDRYLQH